MNVPSVSVVVAVKNEQKHIAEAISSIADQEQVDCEIIVIDDGSSDETLPILTGLALKYGNLKVHKNPKAGKVSAFNYGVAMAAGRFVCIFAGDDIMPQGSLAARLAAVNGQPQDNPVVGLSKLRTMSENKRYDGHLIPRRKGKSALSGVSPLMNKRALDKIFPIPEVLPNEDTWMEIAVLHFDLTVVHSDIICCLWRLHDGNSINTLLPFDEFNKRFTVRMRAFSLFFDLHKTALTPDSRASLAAKVACEERRVNGDIFGILSTPVGFVDRVRAVALTGPQFYAVRNKLYGVLSGW